MLHDHHRVALVAKLLQRGDKLAVVALMQAYRRLVKYVQDIHQFRADLGCEPDALAFAAGERRSRAVERKIVQADIEQERSPVFEFLEYVSCYEAFALCKLVIKRIEPFGKLRNLHCSHV